ncbi:alpha/beta hydrolase [Clostridium estertheticum]|uniref:alpha/beta hydrolase n=1 Tax=Clostridium estertheticum TaxID=238834 RepID=UPI001CF58DBA|nr:alpha/beta hydrolase [Clostridium estertheticum]MCB2360139.1 alpha/beta hydrolase [Clostridium estertheticum]
MALEIIEHLVEIESNTNPIVFVHGANHGAWCWSEYFMSYFSSKGYTSYALSLRGHGKSEGKERINSFSLADYEEDVLEVIKSLKKKPILIGHSMGGAIVQKIIHNDSDKIKAAVLMSTMSPEGMIRDLLRVLFTRFRQSGKLSLLNKGKKDGFPYEIFFSKELSLDRRNSYISLLQAESHKAVKEMLSRIVPIPTKINVPLLILGSKDDWFFNEKAVKRIGKAYRVKPIIFENISHDMMLDPNWKTVANSIIGFLNESKFKSSEVE